MRICFISERSNETRLNEFVNAVKEKYPDCHFCQSFEQPDIFIVDMWQEGTAEMVKKQYRQQVFLIGYSVIKGEPPVFIREFERKVIDKKWREG